MASEKSLQKAAQAWCKPSTSEKVMDPELAEAFAEIIDEYRAALLWCSGSDDFAVGGKARVGWNKLAKELLLIASPTVSLSTERDVVRPNKAISVTSVRYDPYF